MTNPLNKAAKRANPDNQYLEEISPTPLAVSKTTAVAEIVSPRELSAQEDSTHKRKVHVISTSFNDELDAGSSKTEKVGTEMLSSPAPAAASVLPYVYATPEQKNTRRVSFSPSPTLEMGSPRSKETKLSAKAHEIVRVEIDKSKAERKNKLQALSSKERADIEDFEKELKTIEDLVLSNWELHKELHEKNSQLFDLEGASPAVYEEN